MKTIFVCVGTRPNLIKITQLEKAFLNYKGLKFKLLHTGQHYDAFMNDVFFDELKIKKPDVFLNAGGATQVELIADIMQKSEQVFSSQQVDMVVVPGDVNSSFACAFAASRLQIPVAHIESGLRSFDRAMPEEVNRILIDNLSELFFITEESGHQNLLQEAKSVKHMCFTGNTMIDTLIAFQENIDASLVLERLKLQPHGFALLTFHRPRNVDNRENLAKIMETISQLSGFLTVVFPAHPRTLKKLKEFGFLKQLSDNEHVKLTSPLGYLDFMKLVKQAKMVITDSGGIQEETTFLQVPCLTVRPNTERPVTITEGTNTLLDLQADLIVAAAQDIAQGKYKQGKIPKLWDGKASARLVKSISKYFDKK